MKELKSKQRAYLMKLASSLEPIFQIGKSSLTRNARQQLQKHSIPES